MRFGKGKGCDFIKKRCIDSNQKINPLFGNEFFDSLKSQKPASIKGQYVKSVFISTTMGPSILVENIYN